jgi:uncharacterized protein YbjT (DUF2867 family)
MQTRLTYMDCLAERDLAAPMTTSTTAPVLVIGATGKTGRRVADRLTARGVPVRAGSRPAFDWERPDTWAPAVAGARAVYLTYYPDLAVKGAAEAVGTVARLAAEAGAERVVLLAGRGEPEAEQAERAVQAAGTGWTVVRASWFAQNFSESFLLDPVRAGEVVLPVDGVREPFVDVEDIADVAVAALLDEGHAGQVYDVTGPRLMTFDEAVAEVGRACGRTIGFAQIPIDAFVDAVAAELPADHVELLRYLFTEVLDGRNAHLGDGVRRALGRDPRDFADYARDAAAGGAWG